MKQLIILIAISLMSALGHTTPANKIVLVIFENTSFDKTMAQPYFKKFANQGALFTNFHAVTHPSQPNYLALVAGSTFNVDHNNKIDLNETTIVDLLEAKGKTWHVYADGFPGNCSQREVAGAYARKHNPLISFRTVSGNPKRCANITDSTKFTEDFKNRKIADFTMYIPDQNNDGHDTGVAFADKWFAKTFDPLIQDKNAMDGVLVIAIFDEDDGTSKNRIYTAFVGADVNPGKIVSNSYDHYDLLRTMEKILGLGDLGRNDAKRNPITGYLK